MTNADLSWDDIENELMLVEKRVSWYKSEMGNLLKKASQLGISNKEIEIKLEKYTASYKNAYYAGFCFVFLYVKNSTCKLTYTVWG